jgi:hypothetical protein
VAGQHRPAPVTASPGRGLPAAHGSRGAGEFANIWPAGYRRGQRRSPAAPMFGGMVTASRHPARPWLPRAAGVLFAAALVLSPASAAVASGHPPVRSAVPASPAAQPGTLTTTTTSVPNGHTITFSYSVPAGEVSSTNWVGLYRQGQIPGQVASTTWQYTPNASGSEAPAAAPSRRCRARWRSGTIPSAQGHVGPSQAPAPGLAVAALLTPRRAADHTRSGVDHSDGAGGRAPAGVPCHGWSARRLARRVPR